MCAVATLLCCAVVVMTVVSLCIVVYALRNEMRG